MRRFCSRSLHGLFAPRRPATRRRGCGPAAPLSRCVRTQEDWSEPAALTRGPSPAQGGEQPSQHPLEVLEEYWQQARGVRLAVEALHTLHLSPHAQQAGSPSAAPGPDVIEQLAARTRLSAAQVQRWFARRIVSLSVAHPATAVVESTAESAESPPEVRLDRACVSALLAPANESYQIDAGSALSPGRAHRSGTRACPAVSHACAIPSDICAPAQPGDKGTRRRRLSEELEPPLSEVRGASGVSAWCPLTQSTGPRGPRAGSRGPVRASHVA